MKVPFDGIHKQPSFTKDLDFKDIEEASAIVYTEGDLVVAEDRYGNEIAYREAGVDDASVIQQAIDTVLNNGGGVVFLKSSKTKTLAQTGHYETWADYVLNTPITLYCKPNASVSLIGENVWLHFPNLQAGDKAISVIKDPYSGYSPPAKISGLGIIGNPNNVVGTAVYLKDTWNNVVVEHLNIQNFETAIHLYGACYINKIHQIRAYSCINGVVLNAYNNETPNGVLIDHFDGPYSPSDYYARSCGIRHLAGDGVRITNCWIERAREGIYSDGEATYISNVNISHARVGIHLGAGCWYPKLSNLIINVSSSADEECYGIIDEFRNIYDDFLVNSRIGVDATKRPGYGILARQKMQLIGVEIAMKGGHAKGIRLDRGGMLRLDGCLIRSYNRVDGIYINQPNCDIHITNSRFQLARVTGDLTKNWGLFVSNSSFDMSSNGDRAIYASLERAYISNCFIYAPGGRGYAIEIIGNAGARIMCNDIYGSIKVTEGQPVIAFNRILQTNINNAIETNANAIVFGNEIPSGKSIYPANVLGDYNINFKQKIR